MILQLGVHLGQQNMDMATLRSTWRRLDEAGVDWLSHLLRIKLIDWAMLMVDYSRIQCLWRLIFYFMM